ncbi:MAG: BatA domain-containing protein [Pseudohongiellaceae bacterium]
MSFLSPLFLAGLFAALIPVAIHLIRREKPPKLMFSTIRFLKKTSKKLIFFQQIQQWLLLLMRGALIALLVLAFARPVVDQSISELLDTAPRSVAILVDESMSMRYGDSFEDAKAAALEVLDELDAGDEAALIRFAGGTAGVMELTTDLESLRTRINDLDQPGYGATRFMPGLQLADQVLSQARFQDRSVYLISDFQQAGLTDAESGWKLAPGVKFFGMDVGNEESTNLVLTDVRAPEQLLEAEEAESTILARVRSTGSVHARNGEVTLSLDGTVIDRQPVDLDEQSEAVVTFNPALGNEAVHIGEVRVTGDNFAVDNVRYFSITILPRINVLVVNGDPSDDWYDDEAHWFNLALSSGVTSPFNVEAIDPENLASEALQRNDVLVLLNVGGLAASQTDAITRYVQEGGNLLLAPGDRVDPQRFNQQFASVTPATLAFGESSGIGDYLVIADFDSRHPALRSLNNEWSARFEGYWSLTPNPGTESLMQFDNAQPALVEHDVGEGKVMLFASSLDLEWNNLPLQGLFLPFIHETLRYLVQPPARQGAYTVGDTIELPEGVTRVTDPEDNEMPVAANNVITARMPGVMEASRGTDRQLYAVNVTPEESYLSRVAVSNLYDLVINPETEPVQSRDVRAAQLIAELERPQRIWWWILLMAALLLVFESYLANRTYR